MPLQIAIVSGSLTQLQKKSKQIRGKGYSIVLEERVFDKIGKNIVPIRIYIEPLDDYPFLTGTEKDYEKFRLYTEIILSSLPQLADWIALNPFKVTEHEQGPGTLTVCQFCLRNPVPDMYIRQLPMGCISILRGIPQ